MENDLNSCADVVDSRLWKGSNNKFSKLSALMVKPWAVGRPASSSSLETAVVLRYEAGLDALRSTFQR